MAVQFRRASFQLGRGCARIAVTLFVDAGQGRPFTTVWVQKVAFRVSPRTLWPFCGLLALCDGTPDDRDENVSYLTSCATRIRLGQEKTGRVTRSAYKILFRKKDGDGWRDAEVRPCRL